MHRSVVGARYDIAAFGELVSDPTRVAMLLSLMDGLARPASELARMAHVAPSTASSHLGRLLRGGLVVVESLGRHRYFRLASDEVADALEILALGTLPRRGRSREDHSRAALSHARTCYRHLAGQLGVAWLASLERQGLLRIRDGALTLSPAGTDRFGQLGLVVPHAQTGKPCLDWTERRHHLGGPLGVLLTQHLLEMRWLARREERRALRITARGREGLSRFGLVGSLLDAAS